MSNPCCFNAPKTRIVKSLGYKNNFYYTPEFYVGVHWKPLEASMYHPSLGKSYETLKEAQKAVDKYLNDLEDRFDNPDEAIEYP